MSEQDRAAKRRCTHYLSGHQPVPVIDMLRRLAASDHADLDADVYGDTGAVALLEQRTAHTLGKPTARFFIKGMTAQLCAFRVHADRAGSSNVAIHPMSHLDIDEANAIERVGAMKAVRLGRYAPFGLADLEAVTEPLAAVTIELPLRRAGYRLPPLAELTAISDWCRTRGIALHFDGARLWEAAAAYGITPAALAALADTVYVSFYKGLGGLGGAIVAGSDEHVRALAVWKTRYAGNLYTAFPYALSALDGLDAQLPRMAAYRDRARQLSGLIERQHPGLVHPAPPQVNAFQLLLPGTPEAWRQRNRAFAERHAVWLFNAFSESAWQGRTIAEIVIGDAADHYENAQALAWLAAVLA